MTTRVLILFPLQSAKIENSDLELENSLIPTEDLIKINPQYGNLRAVDPLADYPWSGGLDPIAPEEEDIPVPCSFTEVLRIMAMSESEQMDTFHSLIESHIDPEFAKATNIVQFMQS
jgi:hypothetical protein